MTEGEINALCEVIRDYKADNELTHPYNRVRLARAALMGEFCRRYGLKASTAKLQTFHGARPYGKRHSDHLGAPDHPYMFRDKANKLVMVGHEYDWPYPVDSMQRLTRQGVVVEVIDFPSWWNPHENTTVVSWRYRQA